MPIKSSQSFTSEQALVDALRSSVIDLLAKNKSSCSDNTKHWVFEQVAVGMVIPDLVIVRHLGQPDGGSRLELSHYESAILAELYFRGPKDTASLAQDLFSQPDRVGAALTKLYRAGAVSRSQSGEYRFRSGSVSPRTRISAVEAKLRNWREALLQAKRYLFFSNYSYIALPSELIVRNSAIAECCREEGIGLISVEPEARVLRVAARFHDCASPDWFWLLAKTVGIFQNQLTRRVRSRQFPGRTAQMPGAKLLGDLALCEG